MSLPVLSENTLQSYLVEISRYPVLSQEEEFTIAERYHREKSMEDAHRLVISNLRYVVKIALEFRQYGCRLADLIQEGNIGLMVAVKKFNPYKGFRLITYATWWIKSFMQDYILKTRGMVKRNARALKRKLFYRNAPGDGAIPLGASIEAVDSHHDLSLNTALSDDNTTHLDMLRDDSSDPVEAVAEAQERALVKKEVHGALALLDKRERMIVERRLMRDEPESLQKIGDRLGVTRERVRQIEDSAMKKLQKSLAGKINGPGHTGGLLPGPA